MVKEYNETFTFKYPWEQVVAGFWIKYPNPFSKHVITEDVISRQLTKDNVLISKRLIGKTRTFSVPKWTEKFIGQHKVFYVLEESICDTKSETLTTYSRNSNLTSLMTVEEKCVYRRDPNDLNQTICLKQARIVSPLIGLSSTLEKFGIAKFKKNADKASKGLIFILEQLKHKRDQFFNFSKS